MLEITIDLDAELPQLVVLSAITVGPGSSEPFIENHCCMVRNHADLNDEIAAWRNEIEAHNWTATKMVARRVPRSIYESQSLVEAAYKAAQGATKEACASICDDVADEYADIYADHRNSDRRYIARKCAKRIRQRNQDT